MADFGKAVADEYRKMKTDIENRPVKSGANVTSSDAVGAMDREVKEQVKADLFPVLDKLIGKHDPARMPRAEMPLAPKVIVTDHGVVAIWSVAPTDRRCWD